MKTKKRFFITGGTGFIGVYLIKQLREAGHEVVALVRDLSSARHLVGSGVELARGDITNRTTLKDPMKGADGIFHLAGRYKYGIDFSQTEKINVEGTRNVLETMQELGISKGVYTSTLAVNSDTKGQPRDETYRYQGPHLSVYDKTKWQAHYEVAEPFIRQGLPLVILMPGMVYGPGDTSQLGDLLQKAVKGKWITLPGGKTLLCWSHVEDIARAHLLAMEKGNPGETYIISGPCHTYRQGIKKLKQVTGRKLHVIWIPPWMLKGMSKPVALLEKVLPLPVSFSSEAMRVTAGTTYFGDNSKAKRELGYSPRSLEQGLKDTFGIKQ
jgi:nucleoside-diphosphate-sugar epimerase